MSLTDTLILVAVLYLIHRSFHKVNLLGFLMISAVLITLSNYMVAVMHINSLTAMLATILGYPVFSYLAASSIKGFRKKANGPITVPQYGSYYLQR